MHNSSEYDKAFENSVKNKVDWYQRMQECKDKEKQTLNSVAEAEMSCGFLQLIWWVWIWNIWPTLDDENSAAETQGTFRLWK